MTKLLRSIFVVPNGTASTQLWFEAGVEYDDKLLTENLIVPSWAEPFSFNRQFFFSLEMEYIEDQWVYGHSVPFLISLGYDQAKELLTQRIRSLEFHIEVNKVPQHGRN